MRCRSRRRTASSRSRCVRGRRIRSRSRSRTKARASTRTSSRPCSTRFYTYRPTAESSRGNNSGLGLSISREIVRAHGGEIWAENRYRAGRAGASGRARGSSCGCRRRPSAREKPSSRRADAAVRLSRHGDRAGRSGGPDPRRLGKRQVRSGAALHGDAASAPRPVSRRCWSPTTAWSYAARPDRISVRPGTFARQARSARPRHRRRSGNGIGPPRAGRRSRDAVGRRADAGATPLSDRWSAGPASAHSTRSRAVGAVEAAAVSATGQLGTSVSQGRLSRPPLQNFSCASVPSLAIHAVAPGRPRGVTRFEVARFAPMAIRDQQGQTIAR